MPNNVIVIGIGGVDYRRMRACGMEDYDESVLLSIAGKCLCSMVMPIPEELEYIVGSSSPYRYRNKVTGEYLRSVNGPKECADDFESVRLSPCERAELVKRHGYDTWYGWCKANWGTKWGTYDVSAEQLAGDGRPVLIKFQCAWNPPNPRCFQLITNHLQEILYLRQIKWLYHEPYDNSVHYLVPDYLGWWRNWRLKGQRHD